MTIWLGLALMTAVAVFAVLWPLGRVRKVISSRADLAVYQDQIEEIDRDRRVGLIQPTEAAAARVEISRRLLAAAETSGADIKLSASGRALRVTALAALVAIPIFAGTLYLRLGSPEMPDQPLAGRIAEAPETRSLDNLVGQVEAHLARNPSDGRGWEVLAPVYMRLGRFDDAVKARRSALQLNGATADREADLGEAMTAAANGIVTADAKSAFERALKLDPKDLKARFFIGLAAEQDGDRTQAAATWRGLLAEAPADAGWTDFVQQALARVEGRSIAPPLSQDAAQAGEMSPDQRNQMVRGMVERLAERLKHDGSDLDGWVRLVRAYVVLGEPNNARTAASDARRALASDPDKVRRLEQQLRDLGVEG